MESIDGRARRLAMRTAVVAIVGILAVSASHLVGALASEREQLIATLRNEHILANGRTLVSATYVCSLHASGGELGVIDLREIVAGASTPRGVNRVVLLDPKAHVARAFEYADARPLECRNDALILFGSRPVGAVWDRARDRLSAYRPGDANVFHFDRSGRLIATEEIDAGALWPQRP